MSAPKNTTPAAIADWLQTYVDAGVERLPDVAPYDDRLWGSLKSIIDTLRSMATLPSIPDGTTDDERDLLVLRALLERGVVDLAAAPPDFRSHAFDLVKQGVLETYDRLGAKAEMTAAGHRRLAALDPSYSAPAGLFVADRWSDPEALLCRAAWLLSDRGKTDIRRTGSGPEITEEDAVAIQRVARIVGWEPA